MMATLGLDSSSSGSWPVSWLVILILPTMASSRLASIGECWSPKDLCSAVFGSSGVFEPILPLVDKNQNLAVSLRPSATFTEPSREERHAFCPRTERITRSCKYLVPIYEKFKFSLREAFQRATGTFADQSSSAVGEGQPMLISRDGLGLRPTENEKKS
jgi:hypothetical protein